MEQSLPPDVHRLTFTGPIHDAATFTGSAALPLPLAGLRLPLRGGAGRPEHLADAITVGHADAALAASIFHFGTYTIRETKMVMANRGVPVRL